MIIWIMIEIDHDQKKKNLIMIGFDHDQALKNWSWSWSDHDPQHYGLGEDDVFTHGKLYVALSRISIIYCIIYFIVFSFTTVIVTTFSTIFMCRGFNSFF